MTLLIDPIAFNSGTGSDTAASGSADSGVSLSGTGAILNTSTTVTGITTTSAVAGDLLWVDSSSGRQFSVIATVVSGTEVTVDDAFSVTESGRNWGIGGKRATLDNANSRKLFSADLKPGWIIEIEDDQAITSPIDLAIDGDTVVGAIWLRSDAGNNHTIITNANSAVLQISKKYWRLTRLTLKCSNVTKTTAYGLQITANNLGCIFEEIICGDPADTNNLGVGLKWTGGNITFARFINCAFINCDSHGVHNFFSRGSFRWCVFVGNGGAGFLSHSSGAGLRVDFSDSVFANNGAAGLDIPNSAVQYASVINCVMDGNTDEGFGVSNAGHDLAQLIFLNNQITNNGGGGVLVNTKKLFNNWMVDHNNYFNNTGAARTNFPTGANDTSADPGYTDRTKPTYDFAVGTNPKAAGYPDSTTAIGAGTTGTNTFIDQGAAQREEPAGGAGGGTAGRSYPRGVA